MTVDFLFDYASPWSYLADALLERRLVGVSIRHVPIYLRGLEAFATGVPYGGHKLRYVAHDLARCAGHEGVPLQLPSEFPINGLYALRGALWAQRNGCFEAYHRPMFRAAWLHGRPISSKQVVIDVAREAGLDADALALGIEDAPLKADLKAQTAAYQERGVFGLPAFFVGDELFWGHDRMDYVARSAAVGVR